jgi:hypothetical protein
MPFNLPLKDMGLHEKLAAMESLWEDIARTPSNLQPGAKTSLMSAANDSPMVNLNSSIGRPPKRISETRSCENQAPETLKSSRNQSLKIAL